MKKILFICVLGITFNSFSQENKDSIPVPKKWSAYGEFTFLFNQSTFTNWKAGGDNTIAGNIGINYDFNYKNGNINWDNRIITVYGLSNIKDEGFRKTSDRFEYNSLLGYNTKKYWFFSFFLNFKTQYSRGLDYKKTPRLAISDFFSPAYLAFGPGMLWKKTDKMTINIAPATSRFTFVSDEFSGKYGVLLGDNVKFGLGFSLSGYFKFPIMENVTLENILALYSDYLHNPENIDVDYQINYNIVVNKYLSMKVNLHLLIDDNASSKVQFKEIFGLGFKYVFHEK